MNKKLLAIAVSAAMVAPAAAMAGVTVYGHAQVEVASYSEDTTGSGKDGVAVVDAGGRGRVGVKASEDLGNGLTGIAQYEFKADAADNSTGGCSVSTSVDQPITLDEVADGVDYNGDGDMLDLVPATASSSCSSNASLTGRVSLVGIKGAFGTVTLGNLKSPYKYSGGVKYDPFVTTALEARKNGGMTSGSKGHNGFVSNMIGYASPKGPFTLSAIYGATEDEGNSAVAAKYKAGGIEAFVALYDDGDISEYTANKIGGSFKTGNHKIVAQYESVDTGTTEPTVMFLGYQMKMGKNTFVLQAGDTDPDTTADNTTYTALGVIHKFTKTTRVYAGYRNTSDVESAVTVGIRKDFSTK